MRGPRLNARSRCFVYTSGSCVISGIGKSPNRWPISGCRLKKGARNYIIRYAPPHRYICRTKIEEFRTPVSGVNSGDYRNSDTSESRLDAASPPGNPAFHSPVSSLDRHRPARYGRSLNRQLQLYRCFRGPKRHRGN